MHVRIAMWLGGARKKKCPLDLIRGCKPLIALRWDAEITANVTRSQSCLVPRFSNLPCHNHTKHYKKRTGVPLIQVTYFIEVPKFT